MKLYDKAQYKFYIYFYKSQILKCLTFNKEQTLPSDVYGSIFL